jgi:hypothetical protein
MAASSSDCSTALTSRSEREPAPALRRRRHGAVGRPDHRAGRLVQDDEVEANLLLPARVEHSRPVRAVAGLQERTAGVDVLRAGGGEVGAHELGDQRHRRDCLCRTGAEANLTGFKGNLTVLGLYNQSSPKNPIASVFFSRKEPKGKPFRCAM